MGNMPKHLFVNEKDSIGEGDFSLASTSPDSFSDDTKYIRADISEKRIWRPIETAVFDDTMALVWSESQGMPCVFDLDHDNSSEWMRKRGFTHWMPLPSPPEDV